MMVVLTGGARSGKSSTAERLATRADAPVVVLATGTPGDAEMRARIDRHRRDRDPSWRVIEEPTALESAASTVTPSGTLIVDCLALWVTNRLMAAEPDSTELDVTSPLDDELVSGAEVVASALAARSGLTIVVTNEVGSGIVPMHPLARRFRDVLGLTNQAMQRQADATYLCVAGGLVPVMSPDSIVENLKL